MKAEKDEILFGVIDQGAIGTAEPDNNRVKILMQIKKALVLDMPASELLKLADNIPCVITEKYYKGQIDVLIKKHKLEEWIAYK